MKISITQFKQLMTYKVTNPPTLIPLGARRNGGQVLSAAGSTSSMAEGTNFVRVATDTAVLVDGYGTGSQELLPAGATEWFPAVPGQTFTFTAA